MTIWLLWRKCDCLLDGPEKKQVPVHWCESKDQETKYIAPLHWCSLSSKAHQGKLPSSTENLMCLHSLCTVQKPPCLHTLVDQGHCIQQLLPALPMLQFCQSNGSRNQTTIIVDVLPTQVRLDHSRQCKHPCDSWTSLGIHGTLIYQAIRSGQTIISLKARMGFRSFEHPVKYLVSISGPLPEFSRVCSRKHGPVFLALMPENGVDLMTQVCRRKGYGHFDLMGLKLLPSSPIQPHLTVLEPGFFLYLFNSQHDCLEGKHTLFNASIDDDIRSWRNHTVLTLQT